MRSMHGLFDELGEIECFEQPGQKLQVGEMTMKQKKLFEMLRVEPPVSLQ